MECAAHLNVSIQLIMADLKYVAQKVRNAGQADAAKMSELAAIMVIRFVVQKDRNALMEHAAILEDHVSSMASRNAVRMGAYVLMASAVNPADNA